MASSPKFVCLFFFLTIFVSSIQTHARESQFFSKVTRNRDDATPTTINPNPNNNYFTNKVDDFVPLNKQEKKDEQPVFLPQTSEETGYGLYGHETGVDAPSTTTNSLYNMDENNNNMKNNNNQKYESFNNYYKNNYESDNHEKNNYTPELKGLSYNYNNNFNDQGKFYDNNNFNDQGKFYDNNNFNDQGKFYDNNNFNDQGKFYDNNNNFNDQGKFYDNNNNKFENSNFNENKESRKNYYGGSQIYHNGGVEKQGMSDTRFMENGKYYYDVGAEKNNNKFNNNNYNTNGYDGNKETNYEDVYNNNKRYNNKFYNGNGMQEEFDFDQP